MKRFLILYYGVLQTCHFLALVGGFVYGMEKLMLQISPGLTGMRYQAMLFSSYIDVLLAAPLGILFVYGYIKQRPWAPGIGYISLTTAFISALYYSYLLHIFSLWQMTWLNALISLAFIPMLLLFAATFLATLRGQNYLAPTETGQSLSTP